MSAKNKILSKFFSIKYVDCFHKQITFLGFKLKIKTPFNEAINRKWVECSEMPIENDKIVFGNHFGSYSCNPKYIAEEIMRRKLPYKMVWVVDKNFINYYKDYPDNLELIMKFSKDDYRETASAKIIIDNARRTDYVQRGVLKRKNQVYIQTFHGSLGIKKIGNDRGDIKRKDKRLNITEAESIDYFTSNGSFTTNIFKDNFFNCGKILEIGHPRNDIFFKDNSIIKKKVCKKLNISSDKKFILYAPTFRTGQDLSCFEIDFENVRNAVQKRFGGEWIFINRFHPKLISYRKTFCENGRNTVDATKYSDMMELLASSDICITDYSSCIYDFILSRKPGFIFATDIEQYDNERGFYYPLNTTPFPIAENNADLINNILNFDNEKYIKAVEQFLKDKGCIDDGHASERVVDLIEEIMNNAG